MTLKQYKGYEDRLLSIDKKIIEIMYSSRYTDQEVEYFKKQLGIVASIYYSRKERQFDINAEVIVNADSACSMQYTNLDRMLSSLERELCL